MTQFESNIYAWTWGEIAAQLPNRAPLPKRSANAVRNRFQRLKGGISTGSTSRAPYKCKKCGELKKSHCKCRATDED